MQQTTENKDAAREAGQWTRRVTGGERTLTTSTPRRNLCFLKLDCGHTGPEMPLIGTLISCGDCAKQSRKTDFSPFSCECGCKGYRVISIPDPHDQSTWVVPETAECEACRTAARDLERVPELVAQALYSRFDPRFGGYIKFYRREPGSPTGVIHCGSVVATKEIEDKIRSINSSCSPLSPTER